MGGCGSTIPRESSFYRRRYVLIGNCRIVNARIGTNTLTIICSPLKMTTKSPSPGSISKVLASDGFPARKILQLRQSEVSAQTKFQCRFINIPHISKRTAQSGKLLGNSYFPGLISKYNPREFKKLNSRGLGDPLGRPNVSP